jgi:hypothetical protein
LDHLGDLRHGAVREENAAVDASDADLVARIEALPGLVNGDAWLVHRGRFLDTDLMIELGDRPFYVSIEQGRIARFEPGPLLMRTWQFAVRGGAEGWRQFWRKIPPPQFHDIFALTKHAGFRIEGDLHPLMANLLYFKDVLAAPRRDASRKTTMAAQSRAR